MPETKKKASTKKASTKKASAKKASAKKAPAKKASTKKASAKKVSTKKASAKKATAKKASTKKAPVLLAGGNPQIAKGDGDAPVQAYIAALPGWKHEAGRNLDALIERTLPGVCKAVKWNSPFYGVEGQGWFLGLHAMTKYLKIAFFRGSSLIPLPPVESKSKETRYFHIYEGEQLDEAQISAWIRQAAALPGWLA